VISAHYKDSEHHCVSNAQPTLDDQGSQRRPPLLAGRLRWLEGGLLGGILCLAAGLRWYELGRQSLWIDEGASNTIARLPWQQLLQTLWQFEGNMTAYYLLLRCWLR